MIIALLGRQPALGIAELERVYGSDAVSWFSATSALVDTENIDVTHFGGVIKAGRVTATFSSGDWRTLSTKIVHAYADAWREHDGKLTLGISAYGFNVTVRDVQKTGLVLKSRLKKSGVSMRLIPNTEIALSSATSHHNKLGLSDNKIELLIIRAKSGKAIVAESLGSQNITALAARDQGRPKRDAFVGMLPPKLALQMINLAAGQLSTAAAPEPVILDPFCGTGVLLQEAMLRRYAVYGTDLSEKMIRYSRDNLNWLREKYSLDLKWYLHEGDAMTTKWRQPIDAVACESYLGQPFSAPPSPAKLREVRGNCNHIISEFLKNIGAQIKPGTPLCIALPAWRDTRGNFTHLPLITQLDELGYKRIEFKNVTADQLLYYREDQVVARELLVLEKI